MIGDAFSYLYVNAKVMAKEGKFIAPQIWDVLWGCTSPGEITSFLEGTDYFPYLSEAAIDQASELEKAIVAEYCAVGREISGIIPKKAWLIKQYLLRKWDLLNLRSLMRGIHGAVNKEKIIESLIDEGEMGLTFFKTLVNVETMDDFIAQLKGTPFQLLYDGLGKYNETGNLFFLESLLDKIFWEDLWLKIRDLKGLHEFADYIETSVEAHNLKIVFRAKNNDLSLEDIEPFLISRCTVLNLVTSSFNETDISGIIPLLEGTAYFEILTNASHEYEKTGSIVSFEETLDNFVFQRAMDIRKKKPFGVGPLIGFLAGKELEVKNLLSIVRSTEVGLTRD